MFNKNTVHSQTMLFFFCRDANIVYYLALFVTMSYLTLIECSGAVDPKNE